MLFNKKTIIPEAHRGLLFKDEQFVQFLLPGVYTHSQWPHQHRVEQILLDALPQQEVAIKHLPYVERSPAMFADHAQTWETGEHEIGLVYENDVLKNIRLPGQRGAYWRGPHQVEVRKLDISTDFKLKPELARLLLNAREEKLRTMVLKAVTISKVPTGHVGFLETDGEPQGMLPTGTHAWWNIHHQVGVSYLDTRLQNMEVNGQEILTKDRVSLRINLSATWQVQDPQRAHTDLSDHKDFLYRELQLALRTVVSTRTLDELLADKNLLNQQVQEIVVAKASPYGLELKAVGARDIVLPGDMKMILAQVVEAQKMAEANLIRRREETQATRSLHNTAKVMEGNPTLLRLKEMEVLEKITAQIDTLNVYGGLDAVMNDMVRLTKPDNKH